MTTAWRPLPLLKNHANYRAISEFRPILYTTQAIPTLLLRKDLVAPSDKFSTRARPPNLLLKNAEDDLWC